MYKTNLLIPRKRERHLSCGAIYTTFDKNSDLHTGIMNSSDYERFSDTVKACVHMGTFVPVSVFTYMTVVVLFRSMALRRNAYNFLLLQHCAYIMGFHFCGAVVHGLRALHWPVTRLVCLILLTLQQLMACGLNITLTLMCMFSCFSICFPLRRDAIAWGSYRWAMSVVRMVAVLIPGVSTVLECAHQSYRYILADDTQCSRALESQFCNNSTLLLLSILISLIVISYLLVLWEGYRAGHFSLSNIKGQCTIFMHVLQISCHTVPTIITMLHVQQTLTLAIATFLIRSVSDALSPVMFGLRYQKLSKKIVYHFPRFFPMLLKQLWRAAHSPSAATNSCYPPTPNTPVTATITKRPVSAQCI